MECDLVSVKIEPFEENPRPEHEEMEPEPEFVNIKLEAREDEFSRDDHVPDVRHVKVEAGIQRSTSPSPIPPQDGAVQPAMAEVFIDCNNEEDEEPSTSAEGVYKCETCGQWFDSESSLDAHVTSHATRCSCGRGFESCAELDEHKRACKPTAKFVCEVCDKVFPRAQLLRSHSVRHSTLRPHSCPECHARFKHASTLTRHEALHRGIRPHSCPHCDKTFTTKGLLKPHLRSHTGEKPFECPQCLKKFAHKHNMQRHQLRHNQVKHLICHVCKKQFPKESRLKYHMRRHAANNRPFQCRECPRRFSHRQNITRHYARRHAPLQYPGPDTDASWAKTIWSSVRKSLDTVPTEILPL